MSFFFDRWAVTLAYRAEHPTLTEVNEATLLEYDQTLRRLYEDALSDAAQRAGIPLTRENAALLVILAVLGADDTAKQEMTDACAYFDSTRPHIAVTPPSIA